MSTPQPPSDIDSYLRRLTQPDPAAIQRVIGGALRGPIHGTRRRRPLAVATALMAIVLSLAVGMWRWRSSVAPVDMSLTITGTGALVVVEGANGRRWAIGPESSGVERGNYVIVVKGR